MAEVEVRTLKEVDLEGATILSAFPSVGLVSTIASTYMIQTLEMDQVCALDSDDFPPLSMVYARKPKFPARVYATPDRKLALFICEVPLPMHVHRAVGRCLLRYAQTRHARQVVPLEGLPLPSEQTKEEIDVWGVGSTDRAREELERRGIPQLETGIISGVAGVLLNEGRWANYDVISLLAEARPRMPDAFAAARLMHGVDRLLPDVTFDLEPLLEQAKELESHLQKLKEQAKPAVERGPEMYR